MEIFLSHFSGDQPIAEALQDLLDKMFGSESVHVAFSSDQQSGGIPPGEQWLAWITQHIKKANRTFVLLTPASAGRPWVLWESGAAAGVALALSKKNSVVPIKFGIGDEDIPSPFRASQNVPGDTQKGVIRLLREINDHLGQRCVVDELFDQRAEHCVPKFVRSVKKILREQQSFRSPLESIHSAFPVGKLQGSWVTSFTFDSSKYHADIMKVRVESDRFRAENYALSPRTDGHDSSPYRHVIVAELVNRHLVGQWRNISDLRYFGSIQLAVLTGEKVMNGYYTSFSNDLEVGTGAWRWARLDESIGKADIRGVRLRSPSEIYALLDKYSELGRTLALRDVVEDSLNGID
jgi:hypothetical protein